MVIVAETAKRAVLVIAKRQEIGFFKMPQGPVQGAVFIFARTADRVSSGDDEGHIAPVEFGDDFPLKNTN